MSARNVIVHTFKHRFGHWVATLDHFEPGDPEGIGQTEADAVYSLFMDIADREEDDEERYRHEVPESCPDELIKKIDDIVRDIQKQVPDDKAPF